MVLTGDYFDIQNEYELKYGNDTVVLMQVGSFYEAYATSSQGKAGDVAKACNMILTSKNKKEAIASAIPICVECRPPLYQDM